MAWPHSMVTNTGWPYALNLYPTIYLSSSELIILNKINQPDDIFWSYVHSCESQLSWICYKIPPVKFPEKAKTFTCSLGTAAAPITTSPSNFAPGMTPLGRNGRLIAVILHFFVLKSTMYILFYKNNTCNLFKTF